MNITPAGFMLNVNSEAWQPERVLLFSGHMIDTPDRTPPRFPADKEGIAASQIAKVLDKLRAGPNDLGLTQGACGGDILFAEACLQRGVKLRLLQPFDEPAFIEKSVASAGADWLNRYQAITKNLASPPLAAQRVLGNLPGGMNAYERCNLWLLTSAQVYGSEKLIFICLWDGGGDDRAGGTAHMVAEVAKKQGQVVWLDTRTLW